MLVFTLFQVRAILILHRTNIVIAFFLSQGSLGEKVAQEGVRPRPRTH